MDEGMEERWRELSEEVLSGMKEWRLAHPKATFREIEQAVQEQQKSNEGMKEISCNLSEKLYALHQKLPARSFNAHTWEAVPASPPTDRRQKRPFPLSLTIFHQDIFLLPFEPGEAATSYSH